MMLPRETRLNYVFENRPHLPMRAVPPRKCSLSACCFRLRLWIDVGAVVDVRCSFSVSTLSDISPFTVTITDIILRKVKTETKVFRSLQKQVIRVKKLVGLLPPHTQITWASFLGSEETSLKLLRSVKLQRTNSSQISNCSHSKSAIFLSRNINYKFIVAVTHSGAYYI